mgnify:FL=1
MVPKFRVWDCELGEMNLVKSINMKEDGVTLLTENHNGLTSFMYYYGKDVPLMLYSGLLDSAHNEIAEKDLVKLNGNIYKAVFVQGAFRLANVLQPNENLMLLDDVAPHCTIKGHEYKDIDKLESNTIDNIIKGEF